MAAVAVQPFATMVNLLSRTVRFPEITVSKVML